MHFYCDLWTALQSVFTSLEVPPPLSRCWQACMWPPGMVCTETRAPAPQPAASWPALPSPSQCRRAQIPARQGKTQSTSWRGNIRSGSACTEPRLHSFLLWKKGAVSVNRTCPWKPRGVVSVVSPGQRNSGQALLTLRSSSRVKQRILCRAV